MRTHPAPAAPTGLLAPPYRSLTLGAVALISLIAFEALAVATAMPTVARDLDGLQWYALAFAGPLASGVVGMVLSGWWCDARGPAGPLRTGTASFVLGLLIAGAAPTMNILVLGRLVQGVGGGLIIVALYVVVGRAYPGALHPRMFSVFSAAWIVPSLVGPALAGLVVQHVGWRWVFLGAALVAAPAAVLLQPVGQLVGSHTGTADARPRPVIRLLWALGAAIGAGSLHVAGQQTGWRAVLLIGAALLVLGVCAPRLLPRGSLWAAPGLPAVICLRGVAAAAFLSAEAFVPLALTRERGLTPALAGLVLTVGALSWATGSWFQGRPGQRISATQLLRTGMAAVALGLFAVGVTTVPAVPLAIGVIGWTTAGLGMGLSFPTLSVLTLKLSAPSEQGRNSSALQLSDALFTATVLALSGSLFAALLPRSDTAAFLSGFGVSTCLAVLGLAITGRTRAGKPYAMQS